METIIAVVIIIFFISLFAGEKESSYKNFSCENCGAKAMDLIDTYKSGKELLKCRKCGSTETNEPPNY